MQQLVSIIIPTYKGENYILETLNSVLEQTYEHFEVIVVIDGTPDNTLEKISNLDSRINIIEQANQGIAGARNTGLDAVKGEFICFLDHDDIWHKQKLECQLKALNSRPEFGVIFGDFELWTGGKYDFPVDQITADSYDEDITGWIYHRLLETNHVLLGTAMFRKEIMDQVGKFKVDLPPADDWDINVRAAQITQFYKQNDTVTLYRIHDQQTSQQTPERNYESDFRHASIKKYGVKSKDGRMADMPQLKERFYKSDFDFAFAHYRAKHYNIALPAFFALLKTNLIKPKLYSFVASSLFLSLFSTKGG